jgi:hypothetical protein
MRSKNNSAEIAGNQLIPECPDFCTLGLATPRHKHYKVPESRWWYILLDWVIFETGADLPFQATTKAQPTLKAQSCRSLIHATPAISHRPLGHSGLNNTFGKLFSRVSALTRTSGDDIIALMKKPALVLRSQTTHKALSVSHFAAQLHVLSTL